MTSEKKFDVLEFDSLIEIEMIKRDCKLTGDFVIQFFHNFQ